MRKEQISSMMVIKIKENTREVIINILNSFIVKGASIFIGFFTTPAYMRYFSKASVLGVWFTIISVLSWILYFDMGIGNGLRNRVTETITSKDVIKTKKYVSSAYIFIITVAIILSVLIFSATKFMNWNEFFNIPATSISRHDLNLTANLVIFSILLQFVLRLIISLLYALQKPYIPNLLALITNIILLLYTTICNKLGSNNSIINLAIVYVLAVNIPLFVTTFIVFSTKLKNLKPSFKFFNKYYAYDTFKIGSAFLLLQFCSMIINNTSFFLVTRFCGSNQVVEYNIYAKVFTLMFTFITLGTTAIWSAVTKAITEKKYDWILKVTYVYYGVAGLILIGQFLFYPFFQPFINLWLGDQTIKIQYSILFIFSINCGVTIWSFITASICNGMGELKVQSSLMIIGAIIMIPLSYVGVKIMNDFRGIELAHSISLLPYCIIQSIWLIKILKKKIKDVEQPPKDRYLKKEKQMILNERSKSTN